MVIGKLKYWIEPQPEHTFPPSWTRSHLANGEYRVVVLLYLRAVGLFREAGIEGNCCVGDSVPMRVFRSAWPG